jgi:hypothetical protein
METARQKAREAFRKMRFGMFIHWGIYSLLERGEWVMYHEKIPIHEYEKLMNQFNPPSIIRANGLHWSSVLGCDISQSLRSTMTGSVCMTAS